MVKVDLSKYLKEKHYGDIETRGFWDSVHTQEDVHCLCSVVEDKETGEDLVLLFHDHPEFDNAKVWDSVDQKEYTIPPRSGSLIDGVRYWYAIGKNNGRLSVHNCMTFDKPIIEKIWDKCIIPFEVWEDTLVISKVQWYDRTKPKGCKSAHGLEAYGRVFGIKKPPIKCWKDMDTYKLHRVIEDCKIQKKTSQYLEKEAAELKKRYNMDFTAAIKMESKYAALCWSQELHGALIDREHVDKCLVFLEGITAELANEIEPSLPMTLKKKGGRIGRKDITELLIGKDVPDLMHNGEIVKPYYKPYTSFHNDASESYYYGFHLSHGDSPHFKLLKDFREWVKTTHPDTVFKEWEYQKGKKEGKILDKHTCTHFDLTPTDIDIIVGAHTRISWEKSTLTQHEIVKGYLITQGIKWAEEWNLKKDSEGNIVRAEYDTVVRYPKNAHKDHQLTYDVKKGSPLVTSPKFGEKEYEQLGDDAIVGRKVAQYNTYMHRRRYLSNPKDPEEKGVVAHIREDGRIPCGLGNFMTSTGRSNQRNIVNLPSIKALYGKEMRKSIKAPEGKVLVGADQKSSQLSIAAFIANNVDYYQAVASGNQFVNGANNEEIYVGESAHCVNARNFGLVTEEEWKKAVNTQDKVLISKISMKRDKYAKGAAFGVIFGCSGSKLGLMLDIPAKEGNETKNKYLKEMGLDVVIEFVKRCSQQFKRGRGFYIPIAFGYWLWCKSPHVGVNYFCQGIEALIQKIAVLKFKSLLKVHGLSENTATILQVHDEQLIETAEDCGKQVGELACEAYTWAGKELHKWYTENTWAFPAGGTPEIIPDFAGGYAVGQTYYDCH